MLVFIIVFNPTHSRYWQQQLGFVMTKQQLQVKKKEEELESDRVAAAAAAAAGTVGRCECE